MLETRLIGKFDVQCDGKPVTISSRAAQSLFAYLILNAGTSHRREKLAGIFWPDLGEEKARAYLRHELWRIRQAFPSKLQSDYLIADAISITFNASSEYWLDVNALEGVSETASIEELMAALFAYQGELLSGLYDEWVVVEREHIRSVQEQKMRRLLERLEYEKRWPQILEWAERWISFGQAPEVAYRALMIAYGALGDRARVASAYKRCMQALAELGLEPSDETRGLSEKWPSLPNNIPIPMTSLIGRETELKEVAALLSKSRLVTLTGSGGMGKTRLSIQVAEEVLRMFPDGVWFLDLAPLSDPALVPATLASALGLCEAGNTKLAVTDLLVNFMSSRKALVIFDNCEHLIKACARLVDLLLTACKDLSILATSRQALRVSGEIRYRVPSLEVPKVATEKRIQVLANTASVRLFLERAAGVSPGFAINPQNVFDIAQICRRLDGIPLAIELAAARTNIMTVAQIVRRLDDRFNLLTRGLRSALPRHQTLRATIEWSYGLLSEKERILFRRLAVFMGGWTLEAAEEVCGKGELKKDILNLLGQLVDKSLVIAEMASTSGGTRYRRLETIREYAYEKLKESIEMRIMCLQHLSFFAEIVDEAERNFKGRDQAVWYKRLDNELDNLRAALTRFGGIEHIEIRLRFAAGLWRYWKSRGQSSEGRRYLQRTLEGVPRGLARQTSAYARALTASGSLAYYEADFSFSDQTRKEALTIFRKLEDKVGIADCLNGLGNSAMSQGSYDSAHMCYEQSLIIRRELRDEWGVARLLGNLGLLAYFQSDYIRAHSLHLQSLTLFRELGDEEGAANELVNLGDVVRHQQDLSAAHSFYEESAVISMGLRDQWGLAYAIMGIADVALMQDDLSRASWLYKECLTMFQKAADFVGLPYALEAVAKLTLEKNQPEKAVQIFGAADALRKSTNSPLPLPNHSAYQKDISAVRQRFDQSRFEAAWMKGSAMTLDEAVAYVLEELQ